MVKELSAFIDDEDILFFLVYYGLNCKVVGKCFSEMHRVLLKREADLILIICFLSVILDFY